MSAHIDLTTAVAVIGRNGEVWSRVSDDRRWVMGGLAVVWCSSDAKLVSEYGPLTELVPVAAPASNVVDIGTNAGRPNRACPDCGGEWWDVTAVLLDDQTGNACGYAGDPECRQCRTPAPLIPIKGARS